MADDPQRNFRSAYYEKVGFRGVEEKKSLEILLKDNPLGGKQNCSRKLTCKMGLVVVLLFIDLNVVP